MQTAAQSFALFYDKKEAGKKSFTEYPRKRQTKFPRSCKKLTRVYFSQLPILFANSPGHRASPSCVRSEIKIHKQNRHTRQGQAMIHFLSRGAGAGGARAKCHRCKRAGITLARASSRRQWLGTTLALSRLYCNDCRILSRSLSASERARAAGAIPPVAARTRKTALGNSLRQVKLDRDEEGARVSGSQGRGRVSLRPRLARIHSGRVALRARAWSALLCMRSRPDARFVRL